MSLWTELQRRKVVRVAVVYAVTAWLLIQIVTSVEAPLALPEWLDTFVIVVLAIGFPIALILSWAFDVTPDGLRQTSAIDPSAGVPGSPVRSSTHWFTHVAQLAILLAVSFLIVNQYLPGETAPASDAGATLPAHATQRVSITLPAEHTIAMGWTSGMSLAISPNGRTIAYSSSAWDDQSQVHHLAVRELGSREARGIPGSENGGLQPFFSPDSRWVAFFSVDGTLKKVSLDGGAPVVVADGINASTWSSGVWTDDDQIYFTGNSNRIYRVSAEGGSIDELAVSINLDEARWWRLDYVAPANAIIGEVNPGALASRIDAIFLDSATRKVIAEDANAARYVGTGHLVLQRADAILLQPIDPATLELTGPAMPLPDTMRTDGFSSNGSYAQFDVADNGDLVYVPSSDSSKFLYAVDRAGRAEALHFRPQNYRHVAVSPDGRRLAVEIDTANDGLTLQLMDMERETATSLQSQYPFNVAPRWRPDGAAIVTTSAPSGERRNPLIVEHELGGVETVLAEYTYEDDRDRGVYRNFSWHPSGRELLFTRQVGSQHDIMILKLDGSDLHPRELIATQAGEHTPSVSPDGKWLAYLSNQAGQDQLYVRRYPDGADYPVSRDYTESPVWARDSSEVFFHGEYDGQFMMLAASVSDSGDGTPALGAIEPLFPLRFSVSGTRVEAYQRGSNSGPSYGVLPDGRFVIARSADSTRLQELVLIQNLEWPQPDEVSESIARR